MKKTFYITTPIYYPNAQPHMGHAYTTLLCDALARWHRLIGDETYFLTGTDENTEKVIEAAQKAGEDPRAYLAKIVQTFKKLYEELDISYDQFIQTSDESVHWPGAIEMWKRLEQNGDIYKGEYIGLYCIGCESFLTEKDLIEGKCPNHGTVPKELKEENYFFRLSHYTDQLKHLLTNNTINIVPAKRKQEMVALLDAGLQDVSFSRPAEAIAWGIPVPNDATQKMYVWVDALTNYITALGFGRGEEHMRFWPGVHVVGKDILRFHSIMWPAMLLSAGVSLPKEIFVHGMITSQGKKMSKTLGNVVNPQDLIARYGAEATRYILLRHINAMDDSDITWERMDEWYTAHLVNGLGNLTARIMKLAETHLAEGAGVSAQGTDDVLSVEFTQALDEYRFNDALDYVWQRIGVLDEAITRTEPFKLVKTDPVAGKQLIATYATELYAIARLLNPFMPETNRIIKDAVLANKKPENLFARLG